MIDNPRDIRVIADPSQKCDGCLALELGSDSVITCNLREQFATKSFSSRKVYLLSSFCGEFLSFVRHLK